MLAYFTGAGLCRKLCQLFMLEMPVLMVFVQQPPKPDHTKMVALSAAGAIAVVLIISLCRYLNESPRSDSFNLLQCFGMLVVTTHTASVTSDYQRTRR